MSSSLKLTQVLGPACSRTPRYLVCYSSCCCSGQCTICLSTGMYSYLTFFFSTGTYSISFSGITWGTQYRTCSTAQQSVSVTSLGTQSTLTKSLYSVMVRFLGTISYLSSSIKSITFFQTGTYSIWLVPFTKSSRTRSCTVTQVGGAAVTRPTDRLCLAGLRWWCRRGRAGLCECKWLQLGQVGQLGGEQGCCEAQEGSASSDGQWEEGLSTRSRAEQLEEWQRGQSYIFGVQIRVKLLKYNELPRRPQQSQILVKWTLRATEHTAYPNRHNRNHKASR